MGGDLVQVVNEATPFVVSAVSAYGGAVLAKTKEETASAAVNVGRRLLQRIFGSRAEGEMIPQVLANVIQHPDDPDYLGALRVTMREALSANAQLADHFTAIVADAKTAGVQVTASGERSVAVHTNPGVITTGDNTTIKR